MKKSPCVIDMSVVEWGGYCSPDALIFPSVAHGFIILIDNTHKDKLNELLKHELSHIYNNDPVLYLEKSKTKKKK
jgi:hypothetical protein